MFFSPEGSQERDDPKRERWARLQGSLSSKRHALANCTVPSACVGLLCRVIKYDQKISFLLKVHKNENFFGFDFEFCTISLLVMHK
jgi:hypothetical protein